jgi:tRNA-2-methylthio-N6-dimethylallyladenosine synthase
MADMLAVEYAAIARRTPVVADLAAAEESSLVDRIRAVRPDMALSGDFIVGFPGESEADFEETPRLVETVTYASAFTFKFGQRTGTVAASREQVPEDAKNDRLYRLRALIADQQAALSQSRSGMKMDVPFDGQGKRQGRISGRSPRLRTAQLMAAPDLIGTVRSATIDALGTNTMSGFPADARTFEEAV